MLFRDNNGNIVNINKNDFITDKHYYKAISFIYGINYFAKSNNNINNILTFIKNKK